MRLPQVTTFYSYKGGSGRSMTLANVAWALATNQQKVLVIDWDLEAPGLHRYFHPFLSDPEQKTSHGLVDRVWQYIDELSASSSERSSRFKLADCSDLVQTLDIPGLTRGCLHFIGAGQQDGNYSPKVVGLDWNAFYQRFDGETFINELIDWARKRYTHILIDSRTGVADTAGICTTQLPDMLVLCFVYNRQSIDGSASVVRSILQGRAETKREPLKLEFVPCRVEDRGTVDAARRYTTLRLGAVLKEDRNRIEKNLRRAEIRHYPWCAFEEKLAVFEELPDERGSLLDVVHELAARITGTKDLRIKAYDRDLLDSYWQRVAFDDPRLIDLTAISEEAPEDAWRRLHLWLREANSDENQRPDWLMSLAEQTMGFVARRGMKLPPDEREFACRVAEASARHAFQADPDFYGPRFALVLHARAAQYLEARQLIQASVAIRNAIGLLQKEQSPTLRWRLGRSLERCGDILSAREDHAGALEAYQHALRTYQERNNRVSIAGTEFDIVRTMRLSAGAQVLLGNLDAGNGSIRSAARLLISVPMSAVERDASEAVRIFKARLRIAAQAEGAEFEKTCRWVQEAARKLLSPTALSEVDLDIVVVRAQRLSQAGRWHDALLILDESPPEFRWDPTIVTLRLRTMMADGSMKEARDYLAQAVKEHKIAMVPDLLNVAQELLINDGDSSSFADLLTSWLESGDEPSDRLLTPLFRNVLAHSNVSGDIDHAKLISLLELLTKRDR